VALLSALAMRVKHANCEVWAWAPSHLRRRGWDDTPTLAPVQIRTCRAEATAAFACQERCARPSRRYRVARDATSAPVELEARLGSPTDVEHRPALSKRHGVNGAVAQALERTVQPFVEHPVDESCGVVEVS
jgi:hypothetical protein